MAEKNAIASGPPQYLRVTQKPDVQFHVKLHVHFYVYIHDHFHASFHFEKNVCILLLHTIHTIDL